MLEDPSSCWNKAGDDEPLFVFRATDLSAPELIRQWAWQMFQRCISAKIPLPGKYERAKHTAMDMELWHGPKKWPD
jgi:hypothetical protein